MVILTKELKEKTADKAENTYTCRSQNFQLHFHYSSVEYVPVKTTEALWHSVQMARWLRLVSQGVNLHALVVIAINNIVNHK